jgi:hypothetical protein
MAGDRVFRRHSRPSVPIWLFTKVLGLSLPLLPLARL